MFQGVYGFSPAINGDAKTKSESERNSVFRLHCRMTSANAGSMGTGACEYSVFTPSRRPETMARRTWTDRFAQSTSPHRSATSSEHVIPVHRARMTMVRHGSRFSSVMRFPNSFGVRIRGFCRRFVVPSIRTSDIGLRSGGKYSHNIAQSKIRCISPLLLPGMQWGLEHSAGHYVDLVAAVLGGAFFPVGYLLQALYRPNNEHSWR